MPLPDPRRSPICSSSRDGLPAPFQRLLGGERGVVAGQEVVDLATRTELERAVAERARELHGLLPAEPRLAVVPKIHQRLGQVEQERDIVLASGFRERNGAGEQIGSTGRVTHHQGTAACRGETLDCAHAELAVLVVAELGPVAVRLLEVVAEDLVVLDELGAALLRASRRSARAARRGSPSAAPRRRRRGSAGGGSGRRPRRRAAPGPGGRAPCARGRRVGARPCASSGSERLHRAAVEEPGPRPRRARARSRSPARAGRAAPRAAPGSSAGRRPRRSPDAAHHRDHLLDEQRVALGGRRGSRSRELGVERRSPSRPLDQLVGLASRRAARAATVVAFSLPAAPAGPAVEQLRPRHAEEQDRRVAREVGDVLDQVEERGSAQWMSSSTTTSGRSAASVLEQLAERPRRSPRRSPRRAARRRAAPRSLSTRTLGRGASSHVPGRRAASRSRPPASR